MGLEIDRDEFSDEDHGRFERRLRDSLEALRVVLSRPRFGEGARSLGAELELNLVDGAGRPDPVNRAVLASTVDPRVTLEVNRFNLEINADPLPFAGRPFTGLAAELDDALAETRRAAAAHGARVVTVGILPTLNEADLQSSALTEGHRYRALSAGVKRLRQAPQPLAITGEDRLELLTDDVTFEGANTSFQLHLRAGASEFARLYNAAQVATAPALAVAGNSPLFLGRRLWDETRVALFRQAIDDRGDLESNPWRPARVSFGHGWARGGAYELFAESVALHAPLLPVLAAEDPLACVRGGGTPALDELKLHHGTVWRWNRAVYDAAGGGHLRVELRALPAGPTVADMVANAAFLLGLTLGLAADADRLVTALTFGHARRNFYQAARAGLDAQLLWPQPPHDRVAPVPARVLVATLVGVARAGLVGEGVEPDEADRWLDVIVRRAENGQTGARWQRTAWEVLRGRGDLAEASRRLLERYHAESTSGRPVHAWNPP